MEQLAVASSRKAKHVQVREYLGDLIRDLDPGAPAPSERGLMEHFGVARMTVRQAVDALVAEGLLERMPGRGTYVSRFPRPLSRPVGFTEDMIRRGWETSSETLTAKLGQAGPRVAKALAISEGDAVVHWRRVRHANGGPLCLQDVFLNEVLLPGFLQGGPPESLYAFLQERGLRPDTVEDRLAADQATDQESELLRVGRGSLLLRHTRRGFAAESVVELCRSRFVGDGFTWFGGRVRD
ncbi:MAG: GntR family transcriptional regulator [Nocardioides sp.]